jgi:Lon protease-like protein
MLDLPLFPLNTVLFPGAPLQLHIFEERYKRMIEMCVQESKEFGVVLIRAGQEALGPLAAPHDVGCTARILQATRLSQGRKNIVVLGQERFRLLSIDRESQPYLTGKAESHPILHSNPGRAAALEGRLRPQVERFIHRLVEAGGMKLELHQLPEDPVAFAYLGASILQISPAQKQVLLMENELDSLLFHLKALYRRELALLDITLSPAEVPMQGSFSRN